MILRRRRLFFLAVFLIVTLVIVISRFVTVLNHKQSDLDTPIVPTINERILEKLPLIIETFKAKRLNDNITDTFIRNLKTVTYVKNKEQLWHEVNLNVSKSQLYDYRSNNLGNVLYALKTSKIIKADIDSRGTQLKLLLTLEGGQQAVFKPKWYPIDKIIEGPVYSGKDRFGSEIVAFYLSAIIGRPLIPITTHRKLSIRKDIMPVATARLVNTIYERKSVMCMYGKCYYCKKEDPVCEDSSTNMLTGAIIINIDANLKNNRSPWQRTYKTDKRASWETQDNFCKIVKRKISTHTLLDLIDTSIFDFLIQNGDRHHFETLENNVILIDNGKGLGNPNVHYLDILAPLYQCCMLRESSWKRLLELSGGFLKDKLVLMPDIWSVTTEDHLNAIQHRLMIVYATVEYCRTRNKIDKFH